MPEDSENGRKKLFDEIPRLESARIELGPIVVAMPMPFKN